MVTADARPEYDAGAASTKDTAVLRDTPFVIAGQRGAAGRRAVAASLSAAAIPDLAVAQVSLEMTPRSLR
jgi:hypothetical protein